MNAPYYLAGKYLLFFILLVYLLLVHTDDPYSLNSRHRLILVSLDGFACRLNNDFKLPSLRKVAKEGTVVQFVKNVFPTNTLPNHISLISGLYPESHGMIDNRMYDPGTEALFILGERENENWWNGFEPIWWTNQKQGYASSVFFWPGYNAKIRGHLPSFGPSKNNRPPFYNSTSNMTTFAMVDSAFALMDKHPNITLTILYTEEPDETLHENPYTNMKNKQKLNIKLCLNTVDEFVGYVQKKIQESGRAQTTNVIYMGDHGHVNTNHERVINLENYIDSKKTLKYMIGFTNAFLYPKKGQLIKVYKKLKNAHKHLKVYLKEEIPEDLHIKNNARTAPLLLLPDPGWVLWADIENISYLKGTFYRGEHGYTNKEKRMNPMFLAVGPDIKKNYTQKFIRTIDVYSLMCKLLDIKPAPNNGSLQVIQNILRDHS